MFDGLKGPSSSELLSQAQNKLIEHLQASEKRYEDLVGHLRDVVFHLNLELQWTFLNQAWGGMSGYCIDDTLGCYFANNLSPQDTLKCTKGFHQLLAMQIMEMSEVITFNTADDVKRIFELSCRAVKDETGKFAGFAGILTDITQRISAENKITFMAYHDALTGVSNRRLLMEHLAGELTHPSQSFSSLLYIDLDNFKQVNDHYGHTIGDLLLCEVSDTLSAYTHREEDLLARIGGDEFILYLSNLEQNKNQVTQYLALIAEQIRIKLSRPFVFGKLTIQITTSIGVVILDHDTMSHGDIFKYADAALYHSKNRGKNQVRFYDEELEQSEKRRHQLEEELNQAIENKEFLLYYQPQVDKSGTNIRKAEVLIRWQHPKHGIINPNEFVPHLEEYGLIIPVGKWILEESFHQLKVWHLAGKSELSLSINVSANQFNHPDFIEFIEQCLIKNKISGQYIELELTEGVAIHDIPATIKKMDRLQELGIRIALDDFGTGYSSLSYLKHLPINTLKIDQSFVQGLPHDGYDAAIIETTMVMAHHLGLIVVAEGVENKIQLDFLKKQKCHLYQGFFFSPPLNLDDFSKLIL
jgi:diguanylate cyclase (GGDEF)-like protein/PAS domain S-box-containing protein